MEFVQSMEAEYGRPAKDFLSQCFRECPTVTSVGVIFSAIIFVPVVTAIMLAVLTCCAALTGILISTAVFGAGALLTILTLTFLLSIILSAAFILSAVATLLMSGVISLRIAPERSTESTPSNESPIPRILSVLKSRLPFLLIISHKISLTSRSITLLLTILLRNPLARIFLPRWMRYLPLFPYLFGRNRKPHPLKWVVLRWITPIIYFPSSVLKFGRSVLGLARVPWAVLKDVGWDSILLAYVFLLVVSPRARRAGWAALVQGGAFVRERVTKQDINVEERSTDTTPPTADTYAVPAVPVLLTRGQNAVTTAVSVSVSTSGYTSATTAASASGRMSMRSRSVSVDEDYSVEDEDWY